MTADDAATGARHRQRPQGVWPPQTARENSDLHGTGPFHMPDTGQTCCDYTTVSGKMRGKALYELQYRRLRLFAGVMIAVASVYWLTVGRITCADILDGQSRPWFRWLASEPLRRRTWPSRPDRCRSRSIVGPAVILAAILVESRRVLRAVSMLPQRRGPVVRRSPARPPWAALPPEPLLGGGQVGCNWQSGNWVFGIEGDADGQRWSSSRILGPGQVTPLIPGDVYDIRSDWQASVRGRIGYAWDRTLLYATGGVAFTNVRAGSNFIAAGGFPATVAFDSKNLVGGTIGAGVEYAVTNNWTLGVEGRYTWYGRQTFNAGTVASFGFPPAGPFTFAPATQTLTVETAEVMFKANWKFGPGAIVANY